MNWCQKIYFGIPGSGKSHKVHNEIIKNHLKIDDEKNIICTVFHPEYNYGDFIGKLLPITNANKQVEYNYYEGFFLKALAQAYKNILSPRENSSYANVALIIDEINRGNSSAIFGTVFQLLDRDDTGWSSYAINLSDMEFNKLIDLIFTEHEIKSTIEDMKNKETSGLDILAKRQKAIDKLTKETELNDLFATKRIKLPPNLSIIGTMNTSDESIYYMDSAFKRRWDWEYIPNYWGYRKTSEKEKCSDIYIEGTFIEGGSFFILKDLHVFLDMPNQKNNRNLHWTDFVDYINKFIIEHSEIIRGIEDKQIGYWFIKAELSEAGRLVIPLEKIKNKLLFFLWDSVFSRDKEPLNNLLSTEENPIKLKTFGEFQQQIDNFVEQITQKYSS